jgi:hypothetical protein
MTGVFIESTHLAGTQQHSRKADGKSEREIIHHRLINREIV